MSAAGPLVEVRDLKKHFPVKRGLVFDRVIGQIKAVDGVSFAVRRGETFGLVGESGCGKTTIGRLLLKLDEPTAGEIRFDGEDIAGFDARRTLAFRRRVQAVFQDPFSSLNPSMTVEEIVGEPLLVHGVESDRAARLQRVRDLLSVCGLPTRSVDRYPHEMSGGQRQRVGIARALALRPDFIVCDEAVSALDVSIQAQIVRLLEELRDEFGLTYLFIGARPQRRPAHLSAGGGDVSRPHCRDRRQRFLVRRCVPPIHPGAAVLGACARPGDRASARAPGDSR